MAQINDGGMSLASLKARVDAQDWAAARAQAGVLLERGQNDWQVWTYRAFAHTHLGDSAAALDDYQQALARAPEQVLLLNNAGALLQQAGNAPAAADMFRRALSLRPDQAYLHANLGLALRMQGDHAAAAAALMRAFDLGGATSQLRLDCAQSLQELGELDAATAQYDAVLAEQPNHARALAARSGVHLAQGRVDAAINDAQRACAAEPHYALAAFALGNAHMAKQAYREAIAAFDQALVAEATLAAAHNNRGNAWRALGEVEMALADYTAAARLQADQAEFTLGRAGVLVALGRNDEASQVLEDALQRLPQNAGLHFSQGLNLLSQRQWPWGWFHFEFRYGAPEGFAVPYRTALPQWQPQSSAKRVLVTSEWGLGDQIMFGAMLGDFQRRYDLDLTVALDARLLRLMAAAWPTIRFVAKRQALDETTFDAHVSLISLGQFVRQNDADFVATAGGFLTVPKTRAALWRSQLLQGRSRLLGLSWRSLRAGAQQRNIALADLLRVWRDADVSLVSLQYGEDASEIEAAQSASGVGLLRCGEVDNQHDIDGLAELISACDAVVSIDNTTVHLAGALGVPTWVLLQRQADWRWMRPGLDQPWYRSVRTLRQSRADEWSSLLQTLPEHLA